MTSKGSVLVAMSGGVDSSVAACLLKEQGYDVVGSHMNLVHLDGVEHGCCGPAARADAAEVARIAGIPFEIVDLSGEFAGDRDRRLHRRARGRAARRTRAPAATARSSSGRSCVAPTSWASTSWRPVTTCGAERDDRGAWHLLRGADPDKDQSYMLHMLGQRQLSRSLFPIGGMPKAATRAHAERFGLPVASKPDSQELCFAPSGDAGAFVRSAAPQLVHEGAVVDTEGRAIGTHDGTFAFTVGQRRGLGVATGERRYVVGVDATANRVMVGPQELLSRRGLVADRVSWVAGHAPDDGPFEASVRIRYRGDDVPAVIEALDGERIRVEFRSPQRAVAPGQSVVLSLGDEILGGGRILEALR